MKLSIFDNSCIKEITEEKLTKLLKSVKSDLAVSQMGGNGPGNKLFSDTLLLSYIVQKLWNDLEDMKSKKGSNESYN